MRRWKPRRHQYFLLQKKGWEHVWAESAVVRPWHASRGKPRRVTLLTKAVELTFEPGQNYPLSHDWRTYRLVQIHRCYDFTLSSVLTVNISEENLNSGCKWQFCVCIDISFWWCQAFVSIIFQVIYFDQTGVNPRSTPLGQKYFCWHLGTFANVFIGLINLVLQFLRVHNDVNDYRCHAR